jgi:hypothetical protein
MGRVCLIAMLLRLRVKSSIEPIDVSCRHRLVSICYCPVHLSALSALFRGEHCLPNNRCERVVGNAPGILACNAAEAEGGVKDRCLRRLNSSCCWRRASLVAFTTDGSSPNRKQVMKFRPIVVGRNCFDASKGEW